MRWLGFILCWLAACPMPGQDIEAEKKRVQQVLRQAILERERESLRGRVDRKTIRSDPSFALMESRYLEGKITAKQFRRYLQQYQPPPAPGAGPTNAPGARPPATPSSPAQETGSTSTDPGPPGPLNLPEMEQRMQELLRLKAEREKAGATNAVSLRLLEPDSGLSERQRLDLLLRLHLQGVLSDQEYNQRRAQILAEPLPTK